MPTMSNHADFGVCTLGSSELVLTFTVINQVEQSLFKRLLACLADAKNVLFFFFLKKVIFIFRERGREEEGEEEKHHCVAAPHVPPTGDLAHNPGICPDWDSNQ